MFMRVFVVLLFLFCTEAVADISDRQKFAINAGYHAPFSEQTINSVTSTQFVMPPRILPQFTFDDRQLPPTKNQWRLFWVLQAIDVYTTATALGYDCITEVNPIFGNSPSTTKLIEIKSAILSTSLLLGTDMTSAGINSVNTVYTYIAVNNLDVLYRAKKSCNKVR